jgi:hypothetical protein
MSLEGLEDFLPIRAPGEGATKEGWRRRAGDIARNYEILLRDTRA